MIFSDLLNSDLKSVQWSTILIYMYGSDLFVIC